MKMKTGIVAAVASCAVAGVAQGQLTLDMDVNGFDYKFLKSDGGGGFVEGFSDPDPLDHTGKVAWSTGTGSMADIRKNGSSVFGSFTSSLSSITGEVLLDGGDVKGGWLKIILASGDSYEADIVDGVGEVKTQAVIGGFDYTIDGLTVKGSFHDDEPDGAFGGIDIAAWLAGQGIGDRLLGSFFNVQLDGPRGGGAAPTSGKADMEVVVVVPLPTAAYAGLGMLAGVMGLSYALRRR